MNRGGPLQAIGTLSVALTVAFPISAAVAQTSTGVPPDIAAKLREIGPVVNPPAVYKLYDPLLANQPKDGVTRADNVRYGADERNVLDLFEPAAKGAAAAPVVLFFHGGGFTRGDKSDRSNVGYFLARNGVVALIPSYRLAPKDMWPAGAEDVLRALTWAKENAAAHGGDPNRVFLAGESAGAGHVSTAMFNARFKDSMRNGVAGVVLFSGVYDFDLETRARAQFGISTPDPRNDAYFGTDPKRLNEASTALHVDGPRVPTMMAYSALDPAQMQTEAGEMFGALCRAWNECPVLKVFADHDHVSPGSSFNTPDTSVTGPVLEFIRSH